MSQSPEVRFISDDYLRLQQDLHRDPTYGTASLAYAKAIREVAERIGAESLTDYGAGKKHLQHALVGQGFEIDYRPYDPAFPEYGPAQPADLVCCIDVLEHIEPEYLDTVLDNLAQITRKYGVFSVHTGPATKHLADGRNAHLIQQPSSWWLPRLCERFEVEALQKTKNGFLVMVSPRKLDA